MSGVQEYNFTEVQRLDTTTHINSLPPENLLHIFSHLSARDFSSCTRTCHRWRFVINESEVLWKLQCLTLKESKTQIQLDRYQGYTWKETFQQNYGRNGIKRLWKQGHFSNPACVQDLPNNSFCSLDTDSWGEILQWELDRS